MRSPNFRNGVTWSYTGYKAHFNCSLLYHHNTRTNELLKHQKWDKLIFQQPEHLICTKKYLYHFGVNLHSWWIPPIYMAKWQDFIPRPGKIKNNTNFCLTIQLHICFFNQWVTSTHLLWDCWHILHDLIEIMEFSQILIIPAFYSIALENSCIAKVQSGQISVKTGNIFYLSMLNQICL